MTKKEAAQRSIGSKRFCVETNLIVLRNWQKKWREIRMQWLAVFWRSRRNCNFPIAVVCPLRQRVCIGFCTIVVALTVCPTVHTTYVQRAIKERRVAISNNRVGITYRALDGSSFVPFPWLNVDPSLPAFPRFHRDELVGFLDGVTHRFTRSL